MTAKITQTWCYWARHEATDSQLQKTHDDHCALVIEIAALKADARRLLKLIRAAADACEAIAQDADLPLLAQTQEQGVTSAKKTDTGGALL